MFGGDGARRQGQGAWQAAYLWEPWCASERLWQPTGLVASYLGTGAVFSPDLRTDQACLQALHSRGPSR